MNGMWELGGGGGGFNAFSILWLHVPLSMFFRCISTFTSVIYR